MWGKGNGDVVKWMSGQDRGKGEKCEPMSDVVGVAERLLFRCCGFLPCADITRVKALSNKTHPRGMNHDIVDTQKKHTYIHWGFF